MKNKTSKLNKFSYIDIYYTVSDAAPTENYDTSCTELYLVHRGSIVFSILINSLL